MLKNTALIRFSNLYMERSTKRSQFFKRLNPSYSMGKDGERNKKNISKS
ncbi:MAG: hypothetical protein ACMUEL_07675 [Flavobacteriales bacterium Tduv]